MKIAIVTDSTAVIETEYVLQKENLFIVPLQILADENVYRDGIDITPNQFFDLMPTTKELPTTSQPPVGVVIDVFEKLMETYDDIIYITISSKISGTYQTGLLAANQVNKERIHVFDSLHTSVVQNIMTKTAVELAERGRDAMDIIRLMENIKKNSEIFIIVDDLKHLGRTGRVNNIAAVVGALLKIKPILRFEQGFINLFKKVRTITKAYKDVVDILVKEDIKDDSIIMIAHAKGEMHIDKIKSLINTSYPEHEVLVYELSPVISVHTGPNSVGIGWIK